MLDYQRSFLTFALEMGVLRFGKFTLKSGRPSPYFFNAGLFNTGITLGLLGSYYAEAIMASGAKFDMLYGPAYKGIPLVATTCIALAEHHGRDVPFAFNRKEIKDHGEGGGIIGAPLRGRVLIVDDVITAGTAVGESVEIIRNQEAEPMGVVISLDRQERGSGPRSAVQEVGDRYGIPVFPIVTLDGLLEYLAGREDFAEHFDAITAYRSEYGA